MNFSTGKTITKTKGLSDMAYADLLEQVRNPAKLAMTALQYHEMSSQSRGEVKKEQQYFITSPARSRSDIAVKRAGLTAMVLDLDEPKMDINGVAAVLRDVNIQCFCIYTSLSHTASKLRFRVVIPLSETSQPERWAIVTNYLNDVLFLDSDDCSKTLAQAWLLPVVTVDGDYDHLIVDEGTPLNIADDSHSLVSNALDFDSLKLASETAQPASSRAFHLGEGELSPVEAYNQKFAIRALMVSYGYKFTSKLRAIHPHSQSGSAGVYLFPDSERAFSHHGSDVLHGKSFDAFDLFVQYEHHGDFRAALIEAGNTIYTNEGISINEHNRLLFKNKKQYAAIPEVTKELLFGKSESDDSPLPKECEAKYDIAPPPEHCMSFTGVGKDIFDFIMKSAIYQQPTFALAATLMTLSMLSGGRLTGTQTRVRANMMFICTGESGCGKQHHINKVEEILRLANKNFGLKVQNKFASGPAFWNFLSDVSQEVLLLADECGFLFNAIKSNKGDYMAQLYDCFLQGYSASSSVMKPTVYADRERNSDKLIEFPHICMMGFTTPSTLGDALTHEDSATGLLPRLTLFPAVFDVPEKQGFRHVKFQQEAIEGLLMIDKFTNWRGNLPYKRKFPLHVPTTKEAEALLDEFGVQNRKAMRSAESMERSLLNRAEENARRLALIYWMDCIPPTDGAGKFEQDNMIQVEHVQKAIDLVKWSTAYMSEFMNSQAGATATSKEVDRIVSIISQARYYGEQRKGTLFDRHRDALMKGYMPHAVLVYLSKKSSKHLMELLETANAMEAIGKVTDPETHKHYYVALKNFQTEEQREQEGTHAA
ncbi:DUF3987 domain-containing protein [Vibrio parahaemolyticus]|nr:DUF3987 domain-containing protein [Vibrio parahaemolyticus]ELB2263786.1 DUF3987 domain-containing protein [Vibrio parahaemolyticus]MDG2845350.1 DUF3987 domain-containing protein [Vibrio parahaemolyticus]